VRQSGRERGERLQNKLLNSSLLDPNISEERVSDIEEKRERERERERDRKRSAGGRIERAKEMKITLDEIIAPELLSFPDPSEELVLSLSHLSRQSWRQE
jgi:hypothetical protein